MRPFLKTTETFAPGTLSLPGRYYTSEELFAADPELRAAHRERQEALQHRQDFYRIRLEHQLEADHVISQRAAPPQICAEQHEASIDSLRELDRWHLAQCAREHAAFEERLRLRLINFVNVAAQMTDQFPKFFPNVCGMRSRIF